jgi:hypothetical protein
MYRLPLSGFLILIHTCPSVRVSGLPLGGGNMVPKFQRTIEERDNLETFEMTLVELPVPVDLIHRLIPLPTWLWYGLSRVYALLPVLFTRYQASSIQAGPRQMIGTCTA